MAYNASYPIELGIRLFMSTSDECILFTVDQQRKGIQGMRRVNGGNEENSLGLERS